METKNIFSESGIIITLLLIAIPIIVASILVIIKAKNILNNFLKKKELEKFNEYLKGLSNEEIQKLEQRKKELEFSLSNNELAGDSTPTDIKGLIDNVSETSSLRFIEQKKKSQTRPYIEPDLTKLILWYLGCATFWLLFGTTVGEYVGIKFVAPDVDHYSWLSFGRLRPVHTNAVFWGWASLAMLGLAYYVIPRVSNLPIASIKTGYRTLILINTSVILGSLFLMAGINNGGGEYREYIWPVMALFGIGVIISLKNFYKTIAKRTTKEIYVSNWYIISAMMFLLVIAIIAYWPSWQNGLGETIIQGYYMHQGVGMWFMLFNLGLMYYFLPQQLNKPIYSYSLGILAFWVQILFYTLIGTHHFIFSAIPWWLQTVAIVGSAGMIIPVVAGTTNFLMTFKGSWYKLSGSYTLPFYLIGIIFYFTGSLQGTAEAFKFTNLVWHFTDFTVAHSHLTMYGIICFMLWGFIYTVVPRLTGKEPPQITVGAHFWLALIGLLFYTFPLMYGSTLRGLMWMEGTKSFIESVELMAPYWLWRAIGGSLMWLSHILFAYNFYVMVKKKVEIEIPSSPKDILIAKMVLENQEVTN
ncbi:MAG: cytochrome oxidase subunit I [Sphingobacteriia bacterium 24-36-13]|jgi:cytochrome c oxidase cbb3-type subunit 1|uniref:cbb3-type cytochrome c oxidase subunit I n=1 Tax=Sediminibacterium sp. TaxID=1917865 RepID=UPI000BD07DD5|nr:cbb3-type cytochrome c oxidase subunit I [Sediminibacterium sp.]OYZ52093.1 MAG: cytochrome oxidase subunit I [Sphingobacteriia bacterium 24-36-13]OZA63254.1 MAG: cytochrome oxidase subunit I [Sphingobacteriia bacterium 39-36-14]HQS25311.1 cbb3-type cytochrome c oxidase subunit I [Sediminibacterium sp.]HQS35780.1 cbb3-type cytochrome c oxidase subunit I [Sediminibacterium sp.]